MRVHSIVSVGSLATMLQQVNRCIRFFVSKGLHLSRQKSKISAFGARRAAGGLLTIITRRPSQSRRKKLLCHRAKSPTIAPYSVVTPFTRKKMHPPNVEKLRSKDTCMVKTSLKHGPSLTPCQTAHSTGRCIDGYN